MTNLKAGKRALQAMLDRSKFLKFGSRRIYGVAECHDRGGKLYSHHTLTYARI